MGGGSSDGDECSGGGVGETQEKMQEEKASLCG